MNIVAYGRSNVGLRRKNNEDNFYISGVTVNSQPDISNLIEPMPKAVIALCDGMGGELCGEVASQIAVNTVGTLYNRFIDNSFDDKFITENLLLINDLICDEEKNRNIDMGSTIAMLFFSNEDVCLVNLGDSRIYSYFKTLSRISHDHTEAQMLVDLGIVSEEDSKKMKEKHSLTQYLGVFPEDMVIEPYIVHEKPLVGKRYLLCSDGLTDMLTENQISEIFKLNLSLKATVDCLVEAALSNSGKDNVTVIVAEIL